MLLVLFLLVSVIDLSLSSTNNGLKGIEEVREHFQKRFVFVLGMDDYYGDLNLHGSCSNEVSKIEKLFSNLEYESVLVEDVMKVSFDEKFDEFISVVKYHIQHMGLDDVLVLFYYCGHGVSNTDSEPMILTCDIGEEKLIPLYEIQKKLDIPGVEPIFIFNGCRIIDPSIKQSSYTDDMIVEPKNVIFSTNIDTYSIIKHGHSFSDFGVVFLRTLIRSSIENVERFSLNSFFSQLLSNVKSELKIDISYASLNVDIHNKIPLWRSLDKVENLKNCLEVVKDWDESLYSECNNLLEKELPNIRTDCELCFDQLTSNLEDQERLITSTDVERLLFFPQTLKVRNKNSFLKKTVDNNSLIELLVLSTEHIKENPFIIIEGESGSGKSILSEIFFTYLSYKFSRFQKMKRSIHFLKNVLVNELEERLGTKNSLIFEAFNFLPIHIRFSSIPKIFRVNETVHITEYLFSNYFNPFKGVTVRCVLENFGGVILILDGFDEVLEKRIDLETLRKNFYEKIKIFLFSRRKELEESVFLPDKRYYIQKNNKFDVKNTTKRFIEVQKRHLGVSVKDIEHYLNFFQESRSAYELFENQMMLSLFLKMSIECDDLCWEREWKCVVDNRWNFYEKYSEHWIGKKYDQMEREDAFQDCKPFGKYDLIKAVTVYQEIIALNQLKPDGSFGVQIDSEDFEYDFKYGYMMDGLTKRKNCEENSQTNGNEYRDEFEVDDFSFFRRMGMFIEENSTGSYSFIHNSHLEFFAARGIVHQSHLILKNERLVVNESVFFIPRLSRKFDLYVEKFVSQRIWADEETKVVFTALSKLFRERGEYFVPSFNALTFRSSILGYGNIGYYFSFFFLPMLSNSFFPFIGFIAFLIMINFFGTFCVMFWFGHQIFVMGIGEKEKSFGEKEKTDDQLELKVKAYLDKIVIYQIKSYYRYFIWFFSFLRILIPVLLLFLVIVDFCVFSTEITDSSWLWKLEGSSGKLFSLTLSVAMFLRGSSFRRFFFCGFYTFVFFISIGFAPTENFIDILPTHIDSVFFPFLFLVFRRIIEFTNSENEDLNGEATLNGGEDLFQFNLDSGRWWSLSIFGYIVGLIHGMFLVCSWWFFGVDVWFYICHIIAFFIGSFAAHEVSCFLFWPYERILPFLLGTFVSKFWLFLITMASEIRFIFHYRFFYGGDDKVVTYNGTLLYLVLLTISSTFVLTITRFLFVFSLWFFIKFWGWYLCLDLSGFVSSQSVQNIIFKNKYNSDEKKELIVKIGFFSIIFGHLSKSLKHWIQERNGQENNNDLEKEKQKVD